MPTQSQSPGGVVRRRSHLWMLLSAIGPGLIAAAAGNEAGGVLTYSQIGASHGYGMLWLLVLTTVSLVVAQEMGTRMGLVTGKGLADLIREQFGVRVAVFAMVILLVANLFTTLSEFAGIAASRAAPRRRRRRRADGDRMDRRLTPATPRIAHNSLKGRIDAPVFTDGTPMRIAQPASNRAQTVSMAAWRKSFPVSKAARKLAHHCHHSVDGRPDENDQKRRNCKQHSAKGQLGRQGVCLFFGPHHAFVAHFVGIDPQRLGD